MLWLTFSASAVFVVIVIVLAFLAPWISPYSLGGLEENRLLEAPSWTHWMGTDGLGRDLLTRVLYGARVSIAVGLGTAVDRAVIGTFYGLVAGFKGGNWDHLMMRIVDIFYGLPDMLIFILLSLLLRQKYRRALCLLWAWSPGCVSRASPAAKYCRQKSFSSSKAPPHWAPRARALSCVTFCRISPDRLS